MRNLLFILAMLFSVATFAQNRIPRIEPDTLKKYFTPEKNPDGSIFYKHYSNIEFLDSIPETGETFVARRFMIYTEDGLPRRIGGFQYDEKTETITHIGTYHDYTHDGDTTQITRGKLFISKASNKKEFDVYNVTHLIKGKVIAMDRFKDDKHFSRILYSKPRKNGSFAYSQEINTITGIITNRKFHENGSLREYTELKNNENDRYINHGEHVYFWPNGNIKRKFLYKDGTLVGVGDHLCDNEVGFEQDKKTGYKIKKGKLYILLYDDITNELVDTIEWKDVDIKKIKAAKL